MSYAAQGGPSACTRCRDPSGSTPSGFPKRKGGAMLSEFSKRKDTQHSWTSHPDKSISYLDVLSVWKTLTKVSERALLQPTFRRSPMVCPDALSRHLLLLVFRIFLWKRTSKLWFYMFLSLPLLCQGFQRTLLNHRLLWWSKSYQNTKT